MTMLSVVIPAYNEEDSIQAVMERVLAIRPELPAAGVDDLELIVVNDGSRDRTAELVQATPGVRLLTHVRNGGYGAALKTGFAAARGELIGFLDADGTYPPENFPDLCRVALAQDADIVIGSRMAGATSEMPLVRRIGNLIFANLVSLVSAQRITDSASGMRVFKKAILERIYPLPDGLNLTPVMSTRALHEGLRMVEVPIPYSERAGRSKLSVMRDGMRFAQSIVWTAFTYNPARLFGIVGLAAHRRHAGGGRVDRGAAAARGDDAERLGRVCPLRRRGSGRRRRQHLRPGRHLQLPGRPLLQTADPPGPVRQADLPDAAGPAVLVDGAAGDGGRHRHRPRRAGPERPAAGPSPASGSGCCWRR